MNTTRKRSKNAVTRKVTLADINQLVEKYHISKGGSKTQLAQRLLKMKSHVMLLSDLALLEDFLHLPPYKRYKGARWYKRKDGSLYPAPDRKT